MQALVVMAICGIIAVAVFSMIQGQHKEMAAMSEKLFTNSAGNFAGKLLEDRPYCNCYFSGKTLNVATRTWQTPLGSELPGSYSPIPSACSPTGAPYFRVGEKIANSNLTVTGITMNNIAPVPPTAGMYSGDLVVQLDRTKMKRAIKDITTKIFFSVSAFGAFQSCSSGISQNRLPPPDNWAVNVGRRSSAQRFTPAGVYKFCALTNVQSGGDDGGGGDRCFVTYDTLTKIWTIAGNRGDDPMITCKMNCFR